MSHLRVLLSVSCLVLCCQNSCKSSCSSTPQTEAQAPKVDKHEKEAKQAQRAREACAIASKRVEDLVERIPSLQQELEDVGKRFEKQGVLKGIPLELETLSSKEQIKVALKSIGLEAMRIQPTYHEVREKKVLPSFFSGDSPYAYKDTDLLETIAVEIDIPPSGKRQHDLAIKALANSEPRLIRPGKIDVHEDYIRINIDLYRFRNISPPVKSLLPPERRGLFRDQGLPEAGPNCGANQSCLDELKAIDGLIAKTRPLQVKAELALRLEAEHLLWTSRADLFDRYKKEIRSASTESSPKAQP